MRQEKDYKDLKEDDIWTTDGIHVSFYTLKGPDGDAVPELSPDDADIFVPGDTIPDKFFE